MRNRIWPAFSLVAVILAMAALILRTQSATTHQPTRVMEPTPIPKLSPVEALNQCIQERFHTTKGFGMNRLITVPQHVQWFSPETAAERNAVAQLQNKGYKVALYLGGRGLLRPKMIEAEREKAEEYSLRRAISKPLALTGEKDLEELPKPWELLAQGQRVLATAQGRNYQGSLGKWSIDARPVRANQPACLRCHANDRAIDGQPRNSAKPTLNVARNTLRVGDALGVAIYVYKQTHK